MADFKFEDYRHPWETGDHWELKREFMERYKDTYPIDRLLCLAQAYSNIELLHCSYPLDVMKEIRELSKPLKACKIFQERASSHPNDATMPANRGKRKAADENAGRKAKFIKFCAASDGKEMDQNSICTDKNPSEQELIVSSDAEAVSCKKELHTDSVVKVDVDEQHASEVDLVDIMLFKMQQLAQELKIQMRLNSSVAAAFHNACHKVKVNFNYDESFDTKELFIPKPRRSIEEDRNKKKKKFHYRVESIEHTCRLFIAGIPISSAEDTVKKTAKLMAIEKAIAILLDSSDSYAELVETVKNACQSGLVSSIFVPELSGTPVSNLYRNVKKVSVMETNTGPELDIVKTKLQLMNEFGREWMLKFSEEIANSQGMEEPDAITTAARIMNINVDFNFEVNDRFAPNKFFRCKMFVKAIAVGIGKGKSKKVAMRKAASFSIAQLLNPKVWHFVMSDGNVSPNVELELNNTNAAAGDMHNAPLDSNDINASTCEDGIDKNASYNKKYVLLRPDNPTENPYQCLKRLSETSGTCSITEDDVNSIFAMIKYLENYIYFPPVTALTHTSQKAQTFNNISYVFSAHEITATSPKQFLCEIFFKDILISSGCGRSKIKSKCSAAEAALEKLKTMKNFIFKEYDRNIFSALSSSESSKVSATISQFVVNRSLLDSTLRKQFVIIDNTEVVSVCQAPPAHILNHSSSFCQKSIEYQHSEFKASNDGSIRHKFEVVFDGEIAGIGISNVKSEAKKIAAANALANLKKVVYIIKVKGSHNVDDLVISRHQLINAEYGSGALTEDTNIGFKMLKSMGWTGGGIGKTSGIVEPIWADKTSFRGEGLGFESAGNSVTRCGFRKKILALLTEFKCSKSLNDLIFAKDFTKGERKEIHWQASRLSLTSTSYGLEDCRQLFVRNKYTAMELLDYLVNNGGSTNTYYLADQSNEESDF